MSDPPSSHRDPGSPPAGERPMSLAAAAMWAVGITFLFVWLLSLIIAIRPSAQSDLVTTFGCQAAAYLLGLFGILRFYAPRASIRDFLGVRPTHAGFYPLAVLLGLALTAPIGALYDLIERRWPSPRDGELELVRLLAEGSTAEQALIGLVLVVLGPALEEVLFRGALTRPLRRSYAPELVVVSTAILFAAAHFQPQKFLPIGLFGLALGALRLASGSIVPAMMLHATYNAVPFAVMLTGSDQAASGQDALAEPPLPPALIAGSAAFAAVLLALTFALGARSEVAARARGRDRA